MIMRTNPGPPQAQNPRTQKVGLLENADVGGESTQEINLLNAEFFPHTFQVITLILDIVRINKVGTEGGPDRRRPHPHRGSRLRTTDPQHIISSVS